MRLWRELSGLLRSVRYDVTHRARDERPTEELDLGPSPRFPSRVAAVSVLGLLAAGGVVALYFAVVGGLGALLSDPSTARPLPDAPPPTTRTPAPPAAVSPTVARPAPVPTRARPAPKPGVPTPAPAPTCRCTTPPVPMPTSADPTGTPTAAPTTPPGVSPPATTPPGP